MAFVGPEVWVWFSPHPWTGLSTLEPSVPLQRSCPGACQPVPSSLAIGTAYRDTMWILPCTGMTPQTPRNWRRFESADPALSSSLATWQSTLSLILLKSQMKMLDDPLLLSSKSNWFLPSVTLRIKVIRLYISPRAFPAFPIFFLQFSRDQKTWVFNFLSLSG